MQSSFSERLLLVVLLLSLTGCTANMDVTTQVALPAKSPLDIVILFNDTYGTARMDEIGPYTTAGFREDRPMSVWVMWAWQTFKQLGYETVRYEILGSKVAGRKAVVVTSTTIRTKDGEAEQNGIFYLRKQDSGWLIDELVVTDEIVDIDALGL